MVETKFDNTPLTEEQFLALENMGNHNRLNHIDKAFFSAHDKIYLKWYLVVWIGVADSDMDSNQIVKPEVVERAKKMPLFADYIKLGYEHGDYPRDSEGLMGSGKVTIHFHMHREAGNLCIPENYVKRLRENPRISSLINSCYENKNG